MITITNLDKSYGSQVLFDEAALQLSGGERVGLVGRNGHGKSTLFRIILGQEEADYGTIAVPRNYRIGHLAQHLHFTENTILEEGILGLPEGEEYDHYKVERILFGLGFTKEDMDKHPSLFSGGYQIRLNLAKVLASKPNLLLLDEPTNYLDIVSVRWLTTFLPQWENELMIISHDREFMDSVTTHTALIHRSKIRKLEGDTEKIYSQVALEEEIHEKTRVNQEKQIKHMEAFITRFRAKASKATAVQSRVKMLEKIDRHEKLTDLNDLDFNFRYQEFEAKTVMELENLSFHYDPEIPLIYDLSVVIGKDDRIGVIGKNGKGKSTLLNLMAGMLEPVSGEIKQHPKVELSYFGQTNINRLHPDMTVEEEIGSANYRLNRTAVRNLCGTMMFSGDQAEKKISVLSGGERSRVLLGKILATPSNLLLLDEPTNHLDMQSIESLVDSLETFPGAVIMVTHSEMILRNIATKLIVFQHDEVFFFNGTYDEFLEKVGWEEEDTPVAARKRAKARAQAGSKGSSAEKSPLTKKESRRQRSEIISEKSRSLTPLKKKIEECESEITRLEGELTKATLELATASQSQNIEIFVTLSKQVKESQVGIDKLFDRLQKTTEQYESENAKFEQLLAECGE